MDHPHAIIRLARAFGLQVGYLDYTGAFRGADLDVLRAVLQALGAAVDDEGAEEQLAQRELARWRTLIDPVVVAWDGVATFELRVPERDADRPLVLRVIPEHGDPIARTIVPSSCNRQGGAQVGGTSFASFAVPLPGILPAGYHRIELEAGALARALVLSAPRKVWSPDAPARRFGVFAPLYSLQSEHSLGVGDYTDLGDLYEWSASCGASVVGTLPLLASYLDDPCESSPYVPVSRLAWNELYLDVEAIPELAECERARSVLDDPDGRALSARLRSMPLVDHRTEMALRRRVIEPMVAQIFERGGARRQALDAFAAARPEIVDYARFRAAEQHFGALWDRWPEPAKSGTLAAGDIALATFRYHLFVQFCCHEQLAALRERCDGLYLDLPVGVHGLGFDTWRHRDQFVHGLATGAPPDLLFAGGQNWAFPPLHPETTRAAGHAYTIAMVQNHLRYAKVLRIDHVMGLHRLYVIPQGASAKDGIYLSYPHEELYAIFAIESHRTGTWLVGEDLGTVPGEVHNAMREHGVMGMHVVEYAARAEGEALPIASRDQVASVNTHDMPTFAAYWSGADIDDRVALGWIDERAAAAAHRERAKLRGNLRAQWSTRSPLAPDADAAEAFAACLTELGESDAPIVLVALDDLWGELDPHNVPGTWLERPNWRRRARHDLDTIARLPEPRRLLERLASARRGARAAGTVRHDVTRLSADDLHWFNEGTHEAIHHKLGAHAIEVDGTLGTYFAVWAPSAQSVAVIGDFDGWDRAAHPLAPHVSSGVGSGIWEGFVPGVRPGDRYKFHVVGHGSREDKADPVAAWGEAPPRTASLVAKSTYRFGDEAWLAERAAKNRLDAPMSIYECHLGSWMRVPEEGGRMLGYRELGPKLAEYCTRLGFTHVELLPLMEHPFGGSWGYQTTGYFSPTARHGSPDDLRQMIDTLHRAGIAVILDWVPSHFPADGHALARFDGTHLYEHADPRQGFHPDWQSSIFNYGRHEVRSFLVSSAMSWLERFHADGLRVDAVASMLYLDYSRKAGEWLPNQYGGRENLEAIGFLRQLNEAVFRAYPGVQTFAEESTAWPMVSRPTWLGGLGFGLKWDMGWMHDTLRYMARDPIHRPWHQHELTFRMIYAFGENFVLPLSHDEVVHGKGSMLGKMPGDRWQRFANLRLLYGYMWGQPGKKLLFMGGEIAQEREWNHDNSLDWHLLDDPMHAGMQKWVGDLNRIHRDERAMHELDVEQGGFEWVDFSDAQNSVFAWLRKARDGRAVLVVCNFTPVVRPGYRIGVPGPGPWIELANSDAASYGGSGVGNYGRVEAEPIAAHGRSWSVSLVLPPLATLMLRWGEP